MGRRGKDLTVSQKELILKLSEEEKSGCEIANIT